MNLFQFLLEFGTVYVKMYSSSKLLVFIIFKDQNKLRYGFQIHTKCSK